MTENIYELVVEETWTCYPAELGDYQHYEDSLPSLSKPIETVYIDTEELDRNPLATLEHILAEADLGGEGNPYIGFGEYVAELHDWLIEYAGQDSEAFIQVANLVIKENNILNEDDHEDDEHDEHFIKENNILNEDDEPYRWQWTYEPHGYKLKWLYELKEEHMPKIAELGDSIAGKISASAFEGVLEGRPFTETYKLNGVAL